jgi:hypothetical protein
LYPFHQHRIFRAGYFGAPVHVSNDFVIRHFTTLV